MSWLFSQALEAAYSQATCSDGDLSAPSSVMLTPHPFWWRDKTTDFCRRSPFGQTLPVSTADHGEALLTWFRVASRAKTSAWSAMASALTGRGQGSGDTWRALLAKWCPDSSTWRTAQCSLFEASGELFQTWPRSGIAADGACWELPPLEPRTSEKGYGSLLPTLTVCGNYNRKGASQTSGDGLVTALARMPTLVARDYRSPGRSRLERTGGKQGEHLPNVVGGPLNPMWCEWFMGFPLGWTALEPLATPKSHSAPPPPSANSRQLLTEDTPC